ncbi:MAG: SGNH/GDSL hydrolase family protein [Candidatus Hydrogenedentes bacterium]|nr:SGNH/GDSL hydrolase family protein [Candidatus Hydrogenedentota bacterium]
MLTVIGSALFMFTAVVAQLDDATLDRAIVDAGNSARLEQVMAKSRRGEPVTIGVIGGSITEGAAATDPSKCYGALLAEWWRVAFPESEVTFVNAGIGATGSDLGAHRVQAHLLDRQPDFVVVEYAVNDAGSPIAAETLEGVVRQILSTPQTPAVLLFFTLNKAGQSRQEDHVPVGRHYGLPMVSLKDALWPKVEDGTMAWADFEADEVHPNDAGHRYSSELITHLLQQVKSALPADGSLPQVPPIPAPLISDVFEHTKLFNAATITPVTNEGWTQIEGDRRIGPGWKSDTPGSLLELTVEGDTISLLFWRIKGPMGRAQAWVDDGDAVMLEGWFDAEWGGYMPFQVIARGLGPGPHTLHIRHLDEASPGSTGHEFQVRAVMTAGH